MASFPKNKVQDDSLFAIFSSTKATMAIAMWQLIEKGLISLTARVADYIPSFATYGKERVLILHLVTFTAGFPAPPPANPETFRTSKSRQAEFSTWRLAWEPGSKWEYHSTSAHWVMAEIVEQITGNDFKDYLRSAVLDPAGLCDFLVGPSEEHQLTRSIIDTVDGGLEDKREAAMILAFANRPQARSVGTPGGGGLASAADLALLYQPLINGGKVWGGGQLVKSETIAAATDKALTDKRHKQFVTCGGIPFDSAGGIDIALLKERSFAVPKLRGWVMELAGDDDVTLDLPPASATVPVPESNGLDLREAFGDGAEVPAKVFRQGAFGFTNSPRAFGHDGMWGQQAWGDPETGISFAFVTNTMTERRQCLRRTIEMSTIANECALWTADDPAPAFIAEGAKHLAVMLGRLSGNSRL